MQITFITFKIIEFRNYALDFWKNIYEFLCMYKFIIHYQLFSMADNLTLYRYTPYIFSYYSYYSLNKRKICDFSYFIFIFFIICYCFYYCYSDIMPRIFVEKITLYISIFLIYVEWFRTNIIYIYICFTSIIYMYVFVGIVCKIFYLSL